MIDRKARSTRVLARCAEVACARARRGWRHACGVWGRGLWAGAMLLLGLAPAGVAAAGDAPEAALERRVGHAYSLATGELLYREIHVPTVEGGRLVGDRVTYRAPDGRVIARKEVHFAERPLAPSFRLRDRRTGYVEGLVAAGEGKLAMYKREGPDAPVERAEIEPPERLVADAGFDLLIYRRLSDLKAGEILSFPFAAPGRLEVYDYRLRAVERRRVLGEPAVVIRFEPDSAILRWLVDPIDVAYQRDTGALLRYEGVSNLPDPDADGNYRVRIDFPPPGTEPEPPEPGA